MSEEILMKCSGCNSKQLPKFFKENRQGTRNKSCIRCAERRVSRRRKQGLATRDTSATVHEQLTKQLLIVEDLLNQLRLENAICVSEAQ